MKVYTYWKCDCCDSIIRGDSRECPVCGMPIPNGVKYLMPDDPIIQDAITSGNICTGGTTGTKPEQHIDENGIVSEIVAPELESDKPNWNCNYCGYQNRFENTTCEGCGAGKEEATSDYFGNKPVMDENNKQDYNRRTGLEYTEPTPDPEPEPETTSNYAPSHIHTPDIVSSVLDHFGAIVASVLAIIVIALFIWLFTPITRTATIQSFNWNRSIDVETYTLQHESGWSVPNGAHVTSEKQEIHHYDSVLDHYETKTRQVSERVQDGYTTHYRDLGNGQAEVVKEPKYKTVYRTETYKEPVYRKVPVYKTKYYYDIGRWIVTDQLVTAGADQNPYWHETDIPEAVSSPNYGDEQLGSRDETYVAVIFDEGLQNVKYNYDEWKNLEVGQEITYKTFRFSHKPL